MASSAIRRRRPVSSMNRSIPNGRIAGSTTPSSTSRAIASAVTGVKQYAVAVMAGGVDQPVERRGAEDRRVIAAARPMPDPHLLDRQLLDRRHRPPGRFEQRQQAAGGERRVEALLLDRRADQQAAVKARHQIGARRPDHMADQRRGRIHAQGQHLALDRPHRRPQLRRKPGDRRATRRRRPARPRRPQLSCRRPAPRR